MIDFGIRDARAALSQNIDRYTKWFSFISDTFKTTAIVSSLMGFSLLFVYLVRSDAPFPIADLSTAQTLIIIAAVYSVGAFFIVSILFIPAYMCSVSGRDRLRIRLINFDAQSYSLGIRKRVEKLGNQFFLYHTSSVCIVFTNTLIQLFRMDSNKNLLINIAMFIWSLLIPSLLVATYYRHFGVFINKNSFNRITLLKRCLFTSIRSGFGCLAWLSLILQSFQLFPVYRTLQSAAWMRIPCWIAFTLVLIFLYYGLTAVRVRSERIPFMALLLVVLIAYFEPFYAGRTTLRVLGIGGGIPVEVLQRYQAPGSGVTIGRLIRGCLLLNSGSKIAIQTQEYAGKIDCQNEGDIKGIYNSMYHGVEVISGSDVVYIKGV